MCSLVSHDFQNLTKNTSTNKRILLYFPFYGFALFCSNLNIWSYSQAANRWACPTFPASLEQLPALLGDRVNLIFIRMRFRWVFKELPVKFGQRTLTVEGSITVQLFSSFTSLDSTASLHTNNNMFSLLVKWELCSDPSPNGECSLVWVSRSSRR